MRIEVNASTGEITEIESDYPIVIDNTPAPIPEVSAVQIRLELNKQGLRQAVEDAVATGSQDLKDKWQYGSVFIHDDADIVAMAATLGITQEQLDQLFIDAATL